MPKKPKPKDDWRIEADARHARVCAYITMLREAPLDHLVGLHRDLLPIHHEAILAEDKDLGRDCRELHDAIVTTAFGSGYWLTGGSKPRGDFSCWADAESGLADINGTPDGEIPMWGQKGRFLLDVDGMLIDVRHGGHSPYGGGFHVVDRTKPFLSNTGFRSTCTSRSEVWGYTVDEYYREFARSVMMTDHNGKRRQTPEVFQPPFGMSYHKGGKNHFSECLPGDNDPAYKPGGFLYAYKPNPAKIVFKEERNGQLAMF